VTGPTIVGSDDGSGVSDIKEQSGCMIGKSEVLGRIRSDWLFSVAQSGRDSLILESNFGPPQETAVIDGAVPHRIVKRKESLHKSSRVD